MRAISTSWRRIGRLGTLAAIGAALLLGAPSTAAAQGVDGDLRVGIYTDASEAFVGGGVLIGLDQGSKWFLNPNLEYVFVERGDLLTFNADFHYDLASEGSTDFWLGGGPALVLRDNDRGNDETDFGFNLLGGVGFLRSSAVRPFLQAKLLLSDETEGVFAFGIRF
jgi:hypothetical protein